MGGILEEVEVKKIVKGLEWTKYVVEKEQETYSNS